MGTHPNRCDVGLKARPKKGRVILWYNFHPDGTGDQNSEHGGCPPQKGLTKWSGNKWIGTKPLRSPLAPWMPDHPALLRIGYTDEARRKKQKSSGGCKLVVKNKFKDPIDLMWTPADPAVKGKEVNMGTLNFGEKLEVD